MIGPAQLLADLVAIPSVNPLLAGDEAGDDERGVAAYVAGFLRAAGAEVRLQPVAGQRCNVVGRLPRARTADASVLLLTAHMDTYPAGGPRSGYQAVTEGSTVYGRGSADAKGSLAAMLTAFAEVARSGGGREAYLAATVDEECLLLGARQLSALGIRPALAITGEPTSLVPVTAQKGIARGSLVVRRPRAHAAYPHGESAVTTAMRLTGAVTELNAEYARREAPPQLGPRTVSITKISSDGGMKQVAGEIPLWYDMRFLPGEAGETAVKELAADLSRVAGSGAEFDAGAVTFVSPPNQLTPNPLAREFFAAVSQVTGRCEPEGFAYGSEAGVLAEFCDASLVFGPGDARYSHREVEQIDVPEIEAAAEVFRKVLTGA